jgi:hypothetical protein
MQETQNARRGVRGWIQLRKRVVEKNGGSEKRLSFFHTTGRKMKHEKNGAFFGRVKIDFEIGCLRKKKWNF